MILGIWTLVKIVLFSISQIRILSKSSYWQACGLDGCEGLTTLRDGEVLFCGTYVCKVKTTPTAGADLSSSTPVRFDPPRFGSLVMQVQEVYITTIQI